MCMPQGFWGRGMLKCSYFGNRKKGKWNILILTSHVWNSNGSFIFCFKVSGEKLYDWGLRGYIVVEDLWKENFQKVRKIFFVIFLLV